MAHPRSHRFTMWGSGRTCWIPVSQYVCEYMQMNTCTYMHAHTLTRPRTCTYTLTCMHAHTHTKATYIDPDSLQAWNSPNKVTSLGPPASPASTRFLTALWALLLSSREDAQVERGAWGMEREGHPPLLRKATWLGPTLLIQDSGQCHISFLDLLSAWSWSPSTHANRQPAELKIRVNPHQGRFLIKAQVCISFSMACWQNKKRQKQTWLSWVSEAGQGRSRGSQGCPRWAKGAGKHSRAGLLASLSTSQRLKCKFREKWDQLDREGVMETRRFPNNTWT